MPARAFTPALLRQNAAFLASLARTGNARETADALGVHRATYLKRRAGCPAFAAAWEQAVASARGGRTAQRRRAPARERLSDPPAAAPARIDAFAAQLFLEALADGATLRNAAAEAGVTHQSFLARARRDPAFAREMALAQRIGADRLLLARSEAAEAPSPEDWRLRIPDFAPIDAEQAFLQLMFHLPDGPFQTSPKRARNRRPRPDADWPKTERKIMAHIRAVRRAEHYEATGSWRLPEE